MKPLMQALLRIQERQFDQGLNPETDSELSTLRSQVPSQILGHLDRLFARGRKGISRIVNQTTCSACHMRLPIGTVVTVMRGNDIQLCGNCGRYLYVDDVAEAASTAPVPTPPRKKPKRTRRAPSSA